MEIKSYMEALGQQAKKAAVRLAQAQTGQKNDALNAIAQAIINNMDSILAANDKDMAAAKKQDLEEALIDRLALTPQRVEAMAEGLREIAALADPVGQIDNMHYRPSGIQVGKMRVPLGVVGIIYESRPNVTADAAGLCLKSGNATILRGGSEARRSNQAIAACISQGLALVGLPETAVQVVETVDRAAVSELVRMKDYIDVIVPRGGKGLIEMVSREARVPVIKHLHGVCHVYIDDEADIDKAVAIAFNAKTQRYGTCNTMETLLVAASVASEVLHRLVDMYAEEGVELRGCIKTCELMGCSVRAAAEEDWSTEYLAPILSIRIVEGLDQALEHIRDYGSQHTDAIVTQNINKAQRFLSEVDASSVMVNASTRFADGFEYGLGAEIGISTDKLHVRGPVGLEGLTSQKYIVIGDGHIRR